MQLLPRAVSAFLILLAPATLAPCQQKVLLDRFGQSEVHQMLHDAWHDVQAHYYDPSLHALDWAARYRAYDARVASLPSLTAGFALVGEFLSGLGDSHTYFAPPARALVSESGFRFAPVGEACLVTQVLPGSDAEQYLRPGDQIVHLDGAEMNRGDYAAVLYQLNTIAPQSAFRLDVRSPAGERRQLTVRARILQPNSISPTPARPKAMFLEKEDLVLWRLPDFSSSPDEIDHALEVARRHATLVLDLRGNPGGPADTLAYLVGGLFDREVTIGERIGRNGSRPLIAKPQRRPFLGKLMVMVDSGTSSAAEIFARIVQLEKRGSVMGDRTAGMVMGARGYLHSILGFEYGFSISEVRFVMPDGGSLEHGGVTPDIVLLPSADDLAAGRDPVLARAAELSGVPLDPLQAAAVFPAPSLAVLPVPRLFPTATEQFSVAVSEP